MAHVECWVDAGGSRVGRGGLAEDARGDATLNDHNLLTVLVLRLMECDGEARELLVMPGRIETKTDR